jgi:hypothetical protein
MKLAGKSAKLNGAKIQEIKWRENPRMKFAGKSANEICRKIREIKWRENPLLREKNGGKIKIETNFQVSVEPSSCPNWLGRPWLPNFSWCKYYKKKFLLSPSLPLQENKLDCLPLATLQVCLKFSGEVRSPPSKLDYVKPYAQTLDFS